MGQHAAPRTQSAGYAVMAIMFMAVLMLAGTVGYLSWVMAQ